MLEDNKNERIYDEKPTILRGGEQIDEKVCESENFDKTAGAGEDEQTAVEGAGEKIDEKTAVAAGAGGKTDEKIGRQFYFRRDKNYAKKSSAKNALVFAILGLLLGPFVGVGIFFSAAGLIIALGSGAKSSSKTWAVAISVVGVILNAAFIAALAAVLSVYGMALPDISVS